MVACTLKLRKPREINGLTHNASHTVDTPYVADCSASRAGLRPFAFQIRTEISTRTRKQLPRETETYSLFLLVVVSHKQRALECGVEWPQLLPVCKGRGWAQAVAEAF